MRKKFESAFEVKFRDSLRIVLLAEAEINSKSAVGSLQIYGNTGARISQMNFI